MKIANFILHYQNHCKETSVSDTPSSVINRRINTAIKRVKKEIREHEQEIGILSKTIEEQTYQGLGRQYSTIKIRDIEENILEKTREDLQKLQKMKEMKIGTFSLYGLRKGELDLTKQLEIF